MASKNDSDQKFGAKCTPIDIMPHVNWPSHVPLEEWWENLAKEVREYPSGEQASWGVPFEMPEGDGPRVIMVASDLPSVTVEVGRKADYLCVLHAWRELPDTVSDDPPREGLVVGEYQLQYTDGTTHTQPIRGRFELTIEGSPGTPWVAQPFTMPTTVDPEKPRADMEWGWVQTGLYMGGFIRDKLWHYALENPEPDKKIARVVFRGRRESPLLIAGLTAYKGSTHPLRHLPRRPFRIKGTKGPARIESAEVDMGIINRTERTSGKRGKKWLESDYAGIPVGQEPVEDEAEDVLHVTASDDATLKVKLEGEKKKAKFSVGESYHTGKSESKGLKLEVLGKRRQWMQVRIVDTATGKPTPARLHMSGSRGEYVAPYGHQEQVNANWFEDYGADLKVGGRNFAYVDGDFTSDMPVGDMYVEVYKGFEYEPARMMLKVKPGQKTLDIPINRWADLRSKGWVTADTHVHFISPHTAWLEAQCEGVNVVNLLASQWGRLFTNVGDITGRPGVVENDTIVYVGTENRNHMLGHMSMLGTKGKPVYPMCAGGPTEAGIGDPDFITLVEWAQENKRKEGVVIRPHFPYCGYTEDPVPILRGAVDALEIGGLRGKDFPTQEWYRYLNCGYKVAVAGGTDKMGAHTALGWLRTYAKLDPNNAFDYDAWGNAVRAGRTFSTNGPLMDMTVEGVHIGETIDMPENGGTIEVHASAESFWPLGSLEIVQNGVVVAKEESREGAKKLEFSGKVRVAGSGWVAARCSGHEAHAGSYTAAHTSPVYLKCGDTRAFDGRAAEHMLSLVEGGIEYLSTLATVFDDAAKKRMIEEYRQAEKELKRRLVGEPHHHGDGHVHVHR